MLIQWSNNMWSPPYIVYGNFEPKNKVWIMCHNSMLKQNSRSFVKIRRKTFNHSWNFTQKDKLQNNNPKKKGEQ